MFYAVVCPILTFVPPDIVSLNLVWKLRHCRRPQCRAS